MTNAKRTAVISCGEARRLAWPDAGPQVLNDAAATAQAHVAGCAACQAFLTEMRVMTDHISSHAPRPAAPREVRERLFASLARARSHSEARRDSRVIVTRTIAGVAALVVLVALVVWRIAGGRDGSSDPLAQLAADHRRAAGAQGVASNDTAEVSRWLSSRVGFAVHAPLFAGGELLGARVHDLGTRRGAAIAYRIDGRAVSYYIMPAIAPGAGPGSPNAEATPPVRVATWAGFRVAFWNEPGLTHAIVADLPASRVAALAHECIKQMMAMTGVTVAVSNTIAP